MPRVTSLIVRLKSGSHSAFHSLFLAYYPRQVSKTRRKLGSSGVHLDAEDVTLSAFLSLWNEVAIDRRLRNNLTDRGSLLRTLALLTGQKVQRARRNACRQKRDERRTVRESDLSRGSVSSLQTLIDPAPDPIWHACFRETLANLKAALIPRQRAVVELKLAGLSNSEIASRVGLSVRSVERDLSEVWSMWNELHVSNSDEEHPSMAVRQEKRAVEV